MTDVMDSNINDKPIKELSPQPIVEEPESEDQGSVLVIILQGDTPNYNNNIRNLKWIFSDPYFTVQVCGVDPPARIPTSHSLTSSQFLENYYMRKALAYAGEGPYIVGKDNEIQPQRWWNKLPCIIVKDSSISNIRNSLLHAPQRNYSIMNGMKKRIKTALDRAKQIDLFFLSKWHQNEDSHSVKMDALTQAVMYIPSSRDFIRDSIMGAKLPLAEYLNMNITQGKLLATFFVPNIIDIDISEPSNQLKLNQCAVAPPTNNINNSIVTTMVWLIIVIILMVLVAWSLIQLAPKPQTT